MVYETVAPNLGGQTCSRKFLEAALHSCWLPCKSRVSTPEFQQHNYSLSRFANRSKVGFTSLKGKLA